MTEEVVLFNFHIKVSGCRNLDRIFFHPDPKWGAPRNMRLFFIGKHGVGVEIGQREDNVR